MKSPRLPGWALVLLVAACGGTADSTTTTPAITTTDPAAPSTTGTPTTTALDESPWSGAPLASDQVPAAFDTAWSAADNQATCAVLAPLGGVSGTEARVANFAGGWGVAFDAPNGPGMSADGTFCEDCGRSAVGVAGTGVTADETIIRSWPNLIEYTDGSLVGYGPEGSISGGIEAPLTVDGDSPTQLAYVAIESQGCLYNVWSRRSEAELIAVVQSLRFVDGMGGSTG